MAAFMPVLFCRGSHYDVFKQIGTRFREPIHEYFTLFEDLADRFVPFYATPEGKQVCDGYWEVVTNYFPELADEVRGIADGAQLPVQQVILMHLRAELQAYLGKEQVPECSTVYVNNERTFALAHNEDTSATVRNRGYLVSVTLEEEGRDRERFTAYCYPGIVPGNSMGINEHGLVVTVNALYPKCLNQNCLPRQFLNRAMLAATDPEDLRRILTSAPHGVATGFSVNFAQMNDDGFQMGNFEVGPSQRSEQVLLSEQLVPREKDGYYDHFNAYKHLKVDEMPSRTTSSKHRQARADELGVAHDVGGMLKVLGDNEDKKYPIYRTPSATDSGDTVATGVFNFTEDSFSMYVDNPKLGVPVAQMRLRMY